MFKIISPKTAVKRGLGLKILKIKAESVNKRRREFSGGIIHFGGEAAATRQRSFFSDIFLFFSLCRESTDLSVSIDSFLKLILIGFSYS